MIFRDVRSNGRISGVLGFRLNTLGHFLLGEIRDFVLISDAARENVVSVFVLISKTV